MKKNKIKYVIITLLIGIVLLPNNVLAGNATARKTGSISINGAKYVVGKESKPLKFTAVEIIYNGNPYSAYCLDYDYRVATGKNAYTCSEVVWNDMDAIINSGSNSSSAMMMALRQRAKTSHPGLIKVGKYDSISWDGTAAGTSLRREYNRLLGLARGAGSGAIGKTTPSIKITDNLDGNGNNNEYTTTLTAVVENHMTLRGVKVTCENCQILNANEWQDTWMGESKEIKIKVTKGCNYKVKITYNWEAAKTIYCHSESAQNYYATLITSRGDSVGNTATFEYNGKVDAVKGGKYYQDYCTNGTPLYCTWVDENGKRTWYGINGTEVSEEQWHKECDDTPEPITCTEKTKIEKPDYCDDASDQYITITSPKNVKYCILNSNDDAEQTYQMLDGQVKENNPYCAVYCKEDYKMTMPGAQYANSGRYFELKNTKVEATRTCYTTNPSSDKNKTNIDIEKFKSDVINAQKAVVDAYDAYKKAEKEAQLASPGEHQSDGGHCPNGAGQGSWYAISSQSYSTLEIGTCNTATGVCTLKNATHSTSAYDWGVEWNYGWHQGNCLKPTATGCADYDRVCRNEDTDHGSRPDFEGNRNRAATALTAAVNNLKAIIDNYEECYNWTNDLCLDTIVEFEYDEQYNGDINFEKVSQKIDKDKEVGYATGQTIDNEYTATGAGSLRDYNYLYCDTNGCNNTNETTKAVHVSFTDTHVKKVSVGNAEYANTQEFQTNYPSGSIETLPPGSDVKHNYSYLGAVFPIALNTSKGVYQWKLNFSKLGQFNDTRTQQCSDSSVGRLDNVIATIPNGDATANVEYVCVYVVSCDDCDYECVGEGCLIPDNPKCPECDVYCENCIFDGNVTYVYQAKSLNELVVHGSNWSTEKGQATKEEIETNGENIYIEDQYTYRVTPEMMKNLRDYNKEKENYVPDDLSYHELSGVKNAYGTSDFLRNEKNENKYFKTIKRNEVWTLWEKTGENMGRSWK